MTSNCLSDEEKKIITKVREKYEAVNTIPCTTCEYCLPCPHGVNIPRMFSIYNDGFRFENFEQSQRVYHIMGGFKANATFCAECGECEKLCTQKLPIIERLKKIASKIEA